MSAHEPIPKDIHDAVVVLCNRLMRDVAASDVATPNNAHLAVEVMRRHITSLLASDDPLYAQEREEGLNGNSELVYASLLANCLHDIKFGIN